jgi:hypothetical protein
VKQPFFLSTQVKNAFIANVTGRYQHAKNCSYIGIIATRIAYWKSDAMKNFLLSMTAAIFATVSSYAQTDNTLNLYVHYGVGFGETSKRLLSTEIHLGQPIFVAGDDHWKLTGLVEKHKDQITADLMGSTGQQSSFYKGAVTLEVPLMAQGGAASGGAGIVWFGISTNSDCAPMVERMKEMGRRLDRKK